MMSNACWNGYIRQYQVTDGRLQLRNLHVNHRPGGVPGPQDLQPPSLNGVQAVRENEMFFCDRGFSNVSLLLGYTGGLVIARDVIHGLSTRIGFHPVWEYCQVQKLVFKNGHIVEANDASFDLDSRRTELKIQGAFDDPAKLGLIDAKMIEGFSRSYFCKSDHRELCCFPTRTYNDRLPLCHSRTSPARVRSSLTHYGHCLRWIPA